MNRQSTNTNAKGFQYTPESYLMDESKLDDESSAGGTELLEKYSRVLEERERQISRVKSVNENERTQRRKEAYLTILQGGLPKPDQMRLSYSDAFDNNEESSRASSIPTESSVQQEREVVRTGYPDSLPSEEEEKSLCFSTTSDSYCDVESSMGSDSYGFSQVKQYKQELALTVPKDNKLHLTLPLNLMCQTVMDSEKACIAWQNRTMRKNIEKSYSFDYTAAWSSQQQSSAKREEEKEPFLHKQEQGEIPKVAKEKELTSTPSTDLVIADGGLPEPEETFASLLNSFTKCCGSIETEDEPAQSELDLSSLAPMEKEEDNKGPANDLIIPKEEEPKPNVQAPLVQINTEPTYEQIKPKEEPKSKVQVPLVQFIKEPTNKKIRKTIIKP